MKKIILVPLFLGTCALAGAQAAPTAPAQTMTPPPGYGQGPSEPQKVYGQSMGQVLLVTPQTAQQLVDKFRAKYDAPSAPRMIVYVNRALVDSATEKPTPKLADQQTVRDIERLFGRVFRNAGAKLADSQLAVDMFSGKSDGQPEALSPPNGLASDKSAKQRHALQSVADIAVEVLISSKQIAVPGLSGDRVVSIPDIQATAIRLKDAAIVGQASASDVLGKDMQAMRIARSYDVRDITEATAFALMEDMLTGK